MTGWPPKLLSVGTRTQVPFRAVCSRAKAENATNKVVVIMDVQVFMTCYQARTAPSPKMEHTHKFSPVKTARQCNSGYFLTSPSVYTALCFSFSCSLSMYGIPFSIHAGFGASFNKSAKHFCRRTCVVFLIRPPPQPVGA